MTTPALDPTELAWATTKLNDLIAGFDAVVVGQPRLRTAAKIARASCRERV